MRVKKEDYEEMTVRFNQHVSFTGYPRTNYNRVGANNQWSPYMAQLYAQRGLIFQPQQQQSFEVKTNTMQELGNMVGTMYKANPTGTTNFFKNAGSWIWNKGFPAIGKAATWAWNGISGLFKKTDSASK